MLWNKEAAFNGKKREPGVPVLPTASSYKVEPRYFNFSGKTKYSSKQGEFEKTDTKWLKGNWI